MSDETTINEERVRREHLKQVNQPRHWAYLVGVLGGAFVLMVILIAFLGS